MNIGTRTATYLLAALACALLCAFLACKASEQAAPHKAGLSANYAPEVAAFTVEADGFVNWTVAAETGATADAATAETVIGSVGAVGPSTISIAKCVFLPAATLTSSDTNYATISLYKRTSPQTDGGTTQTLLASNLTKTATDGGTGDWLAYQPVSLVVVSGAFVSPGDAFTVTKAKAGTGIVVPQGSLSCFTSLN